MEPKGGWVQKNKRLINRLINQEIKQSRKQAKKNASVYIHTEAFD